MSLLWLLFLCMTTLSVSVTSSEQDDANAVMEVVVEHAMKFLSDNREMPLPDLKADGAGFKLSLYNGHLGDMSSMMRKSDAAMSIQDGVIYLSGTLALKNVYIGYDFKGKLLLSSIKGRGDGTVRDHGFLFKSSIDVTGDQCQFVIDSMATDALEGVQIKITGLGALNPLANTIVNSQLKASTIKDLLDGHLKTLNGKTQTCPDELFQAVKGLQRYRTA